MYCCVPRQVLSNNKSLDWDNNGNILIQREKVSAYLNQIKFFWIITWDSLGIQAVARDMNHDLREVIRKTVDYQIKPIAWQGLVMSEEIESRVK